MVELSAPQLFTNRLTGTMVFFRDILKILRKKSSDEILEEIQSDIQSLESDRDQAVQRQNYVVGRLIIYSVILYVIAAALFYFCFFPASLTDRIFYMIPLLMFPLLVVLLKKFIMWYYKRTIVHNKDKLSDLKAKKKKILEDVMNKETYKVAKEILEKYAPEQLKKPEAEPKVKPLSASPTYRNLSQDLKNPVPQPQQQVSRLPALPQPPPVGFSPVHQKPVALPVRQGSPQRVHAEGLRQSPVERRLLRPIIPRERSIIDRLIESIVGDGPSNRYALICKNCASHNGMALKEEFEYLAFRCAYCGFPNPAHKVRPRVSQPHSRSSSEERRKSIDGGHEKSLEEGSENVQKEKESEGETKLPKDNEGPTDPDATEKTEVDSDEGSSSPSDGIRPRKPLQVTD